MSGPDPIKIHGQQVEMVAVGDLKPFDRNARDHPEAQIALLARVITDSGFTAPLVIDEDGSIIAGHGRLLAALRLDMEAVPCVRVRGLSPDQVRALRLSDNQISLLSNWDHDLLTTELSDLGRSGFDLTLTGFDSLDFGLGLGDLNLGLPSGGSGTEDTGAETVSGAGSLADRFGIPPFTVLNAREGWWQDRKRAWIGIGIKSELGRGEGSTYGDGAITDPGLNHYRDAAKPKASFFNGGYGNMTPEEMAAYKAKSPGKGGRKANAATGGSAEPLARAKAGKQSIMKGGTAASGKGAAGAVRLPMGRGQDAKKAMIAGAGTRRAEKKGEA